MTFQYHSFHYRHWYIIWKSTKKKSWLQRPVYINGVTSSGHHDFAPGLWQCAWQVNPATGILFDFLFSFSNYFFLSIFSSKKIRQNYSCVPYRDGSPAGDRARLTFPVALVLVLVVVVMFDWAPRISLLIFDKSLKVYLVQMFLVCMAKINAWRWFMGFFCHWKVNPNSKL